VLASSTEIPPGAQALGPLFIRTLSVALSNAISHESIRRIASLDGLTGVLNRRAGLDRLKQEFTRAVGADRPLGVIMADIDHFKAVNDRHGHLAGDTVLKKVAAALGRVLRRDDFLIRYGGEEFLVVLPGAADADLELIAERLRDVAHRLIEADGVSLMVTLSAGYASTGDIQVRDAIDLIGRADEALLAAKKAGRDQAVAALGLGA